ncbi:MAG TPA: ATP-binding cassette domain-containing protein [Anaerolineae bacterium]|nr:ATP-binding cassette domain-containing protein [Anaerolineae bacterium]HQI84389.1 ATP-binding cassette domain-containing protein [Anaerolineae bacterium]
MIDVSNLSKSYGDVEALRDVSFSIAAGEIVGLLGPNGAGKTTIIKILTGYLQPDAGTALINGLDVLEHTREVQAQIGYLPETAPLYPELSVQAYLKMMADLRQIPAEQQPTLLSEAIYATGLQDHLTRLIGHLSKGFRQRVGLAQAILHKPRLLILDEPTVGLDPTQIVEIRHLIRRLADHSTVLFSTHILSEVEALCDRAIILMNGQVKADARLADLEATSDAVLVLGQKLSGVSDALKRLKQVRGVDPFQSHDGFPAYRVLGHARMAGDLGPAIYDLAREHDWPVRELRRDVRTLETVFNELATQGSAATSSMTPAEVAQ